MTKFQYFVEAMKRPLDDNGYAPLLRGKDISDMGFIYGGIYSALAVCSNVAFGVEKGAKAVSNAIYSGVNKIGKFISGMANYAQNTTDELKNVEAYKKRHEKINQGKISEEDRAFLRTQMPKQEHIEKPLDAAQAYAQARHNLIKSGELSQEDRAFLRNILLCSIRWVIMICCA